MNDRGVILWIEALADAKIATKYVINAYSHSDCAPDILYIAYHQVTY